MKALLQVVLVLSVASVFKADFNTFDEDEFSVSQKLLPIEDNYDELLDAEVRTNWIDFLFIARRSSNSLQVSFSVFYFFWRKTLGLLHEISRKFFGSWTLFSTHFTSVQTSWNNPSKPEAHKGWASLPHLFRIIRTFVNVLVNSNSGLWIDRLACRSTVYL